MPLPFSDEIKKQILENFLDLFSIIASKPFQKRIWIKGEGPEVDSFDDTANDYFIVCDSFLENDKEFGITENQYQLLKKFQDKFEVFSRENDCPDLFIDTPEWDEITKMAQEILDAFNYKKVRN